MKAIGYVRVSTQEQATEGYSLAAQEAKIRAYADLYGLDLVDLVADAGVSAKSLDRPGLQSALARIERHEAEGLVILKLDRLTRSVADWNTLIDRYFGKTVALMSVGDQIDTRTAPVGWSSTFSFPLPDGSARRSVSVPRRRLLTKKRRVNTSGDLGTGSRSRRASSRSSRRSRPSWSAC